MFINTISEEEATGNTARLYDAIRETDGFVPNFVKAFSHNPKVLVKWGELLDAIRDHQDLRRYELATLGAARAMRHSYCMLAHSTNLMKAGMPPETLKQIGQTGDADELTDQERMIMGFTAKIALDAGSVTQADIDDLRATELNDAEIFDIAATACVRCFLSKLTDAMGARPDSHYRSDMEEELHQALALGRPIEED